MIFKPRYILKYHIKNTMAEPQPILMDSESLGMGSVLVIS